MTATDELRRLLDERGVEWWQSANTLGCIFTRWYSPIFGDEVVAMENGEEGLVLFDHFLTPAQAIAATLGVTDATGERQADAVPMGEVRDFFYRCVPADIEGWRDEDFQRVAHFFGREVDA